MDELNKLGWLIRDGGNKIRGPFRHNEVLQLIKKNQLKPKTEISRANAYWFAIEEKVELVRFFPELNGGKPPAEQPTQMTATLTQANMESNRVEITQFTTLGDRKEIAELQRVAAAAAEANLAGMDQIEWLNEEVAEEFGVDFSIDITSLPGDSESTPTPTLKAEQPTPTKDLDDLLKRATVKADTLPSEYKNFKGERPKPITTFFKNPETRSTPSGPAPQNIVSMPLEPEPAPKMFSLEDERLVQETKQKWRIIGGGIALLVLGLSITIFVAIRRPFPSSRGNGDSMRPSPAVVSVDSVKRSILLYDLDSAKDSLAQAESDPEAKGEPAYYLAQALVKKEFLFDVEGALLSLQTAKNLTGSRRTEAEVDNLEAIYSQERDPQKALDSLKRIVAAYPDDLVFAYNLALLHLRSERATEAIPLLEALMHSASGDKLLYEEVAVALGWALEVACAANTKDSFCKRQAEEPFQKALEAYAPSPKGRLGLALYRMRKGGVRAAEADFRAFLDLAPELDPPTRVMNFRKISNSEFYGFAHSRLLELNSNSSGRLSPVAMAADALVAAMQTRTAEAGKILEGALASAPGDPNIMKVLGFLRWKESRYPELVDELKDLRDSRSSFAVNLMLGKAYLKTGRKDLAEKHFQGIVQVFPQYSIGHSLLGDLYLQMEKPVDAKAAFLMALKKDPFDIVALRGLKRLGELFVLSPEIQRNLPF